MNVLMFTMSIILLLATMTYARINSFKSLQITKTHFESYMGKTEREQINQKAEKMYVEVIVNPQGSQNVNKQKTTRSGISKLSWFLILDKNEREKDQTALNDVLDLSKKLIYQLFTKDSNVKKIIEIDPEILDRFFLSLMQAADNLPQKMKIKDAEHLSSLDLKDDDLNLLRYELFRDNPCQVDPNSNQDPNAKDTYSLLEHLSIQNGKTRVFLASKAILQAAINEDNIVKQILEQRKILYKEVKNKNIENAEASAKFEAFIKEYLPNINENIFDFSVTKTNPIKYELN